MGTLIDVKIKGNLVMYRLAHEIKIAGSPQVQR